MEDPIGEDYEHKGLKLMDGKEREELLNNLEFSSIWECCVVGTKCLTNKLSKSSSRTYRFFPKSPNLQFSRRIFIKVCRDAILRLLFYHNYK